MPQHFNRQKLEHLFAEDFSSPVFPILADIYYNNKEYERAIKVCQIGLKHYPNNYIGQFILAKTLYVQGDKQKVEKILKNIITYDSNNIQALLMIIQISEELHRSNNTIKRYVLLAQKLSPMHQKIKILYKQYFKGKKNKIKKQKNKKYLILKDTIKIDQKMLTKTMYKLMVSQKKYTLANSILEKMKEKGKNKTFVMQEFKKNQKSQYKRNK